MVPPVVSLGPSVDPKDRFAGDAALAKGGGGPAEVPPVFFRPCLGGQVAALDQRHKAREVGPEADER